MSEMTDEQKTAMRIVQMVQAIAKPGPGGINICGGIPSEIYVGIGRGRYDHDNGEYELASDVADSIRGDLAQWICREFGISVPAEEPAAAPAPQ